MNKKLGVFINSTPVMHVCLLGQDIYVDFIDGLVVQSTCMSTHY